MNGLYRLLKEEPDSADPVETAILKTRAIGCLDLSKLDPAAADDLGEKRAVLLSEILDRIELPAFENIPDAQQLLESKETRWRIPNTEITIERLADGPRAGDFVFSSATVTRIPEFHQRVKQLPFKSGTVIEGAYERLFTSAPPAAVKDNPLKPADTSSPQATLKSFIDSVSAVYRSFKAHGMSQAAVAQRRDDRNRAVRCLDLSQVPPNVLEGTRIEAAVLLMEVFDKIEIPPYEEVPGATAVQRDGISSWTVPNTEITIARVQEGPRAGEFLFTPQTVHRAHQFYDQVKHLPYKDTAILEDPYQVYLQAPGPMIPISWVLGLPAWMKQPVMEQPAWKWLALSGVLLLLAGGLALMFRFGRHKQVDAPRAPFYNRVAFPLGGIFLTLLAQSVVAQINVVQHVTLLTSVLFTLIVAVCAVCSVFIVSDAISEAIVSSPRINPRSADAQVVRILFRIASLVALVLIILQTTEHLGIPLTPVLAGLGVGGVAIALAAQNSIENLIGGFNLFMDRPISVGNFCRFGDRIGTVEEIGLRSTRVRTLDDTVISIPNASFSKMELENYSKRRKIWYHPRIELVKDTTPDQVRYVLVEVRKMLYAHPKVDPIPARIRFAQFGASSLDLDVFAYVVATDFDEFLEVAEDLNLHVMDILSRAGVRLAVPTQRTVVERSEPRVPSRVQETEEQVRQWRESNQLYLPSFPEEVVARLRQTLDYPPKGAPVSGANEQDSDRST
jgi:MscS family membrane protein